VPKFEAEGGGRTRLHGAVKVRDQGSGPLAANSHGKAERVLSHRIEERYRFTPDPDVNGYDLLEMAAKKRGFLISGGEYDYERMSRVLLDEFRGGKLGRITLERPEE
jgi:ribosome biogenesis GTPase A